ncbi:MAG: phosphoglycolate phosphatase [Cypionkella sp.]
MSYAIVFDLDGTLVDSVADLQVATNAMLAEWDKPPLSIATISGFIGNGIPALVGLARQDAGLPEAEQDRMQERMLAHYSDHPADLTRPYDGVVAALTELRAEGHRLGVCTNKLRGASVQVLQALDLMRFFDVVVGGDSMEVRKPDPAPLLLAFDALEFGRRLFIGDSEVDVETARRAEVNFGLFTRGYRKTPVEDLVKTFAFDDFAALPDWVAENSKLG